MTVLVVDIGTSSVRALTVDHQGRTGHEHRTPMLPSSPRPGSVEIDATALAEAVLELAGRVLADAGPVDAVGVAAQRASTILWDAATGAPVGPGLGWQDLRTVGRCLELRADGVAVAPNMTATKAEWLLTHTDRNPTDLRLGTVDSWVVWHLSGGGLHVTDATNAAVTGLYDVAAGSWDDAILDRLSIPRSILPTVVDTIGAAGSADRLPGAPPITGIAGDQQASMVGQGCIAPGEAKITFGTGAMLDMCLDGPLDERPTAGTFPIVTWQRDGHPSFGLEAVMLAAGSAVEWLSEGLGILGSPDESAAVAATVEDAGGVTFVPSLSGTGTPEWDHGARGLLIGVTRGTTRAHVVRAVLEGVAHRGADLVDAAERATGRTVERLRVDGGMSANPVFVQALADATRHTVEVSAKREATALGAGLLAGVGAGIWPDLTAATRSREDPTAVEPGAPLDRETFARARERAGGWIPALSDLELQ